MYSGPKIKDRTVWAVFALVAAIILAASSYYAGRVGREAALVALADDAGNDVALKSALLQAVLERPRSLPLVLADDAELRSALFTGSEGEIDHLNRKLEKLVEDSQAAVIYVIPPNGIAIAASNWQQTDSFIGNDYSFREYFSQAMATGRGEHYALGTVSKRPGLYLSRRVEGSNGKALGVVVVKVEFDGLEKDWGLSGKPTFVTDRNGIVLITSRPEWRFSSITAIPPEKRAAIRESLQFGEASLRMLPIAPPLQAGGRPLVNVKEPPMRETGRFLALASPVPGTPWSLHLLVPADAALTAGILQGRLQALAGLLPLVGLGALLLFRWQRTRQREAVDRAARDELERKVKERTGELSLARDRLETEIEEHHATETRLQKVQQELVQANRLAILGQVAAGVAHEINQPVATIRAYADNASTFLSRGQNEPAVENLAFIAKLTERIGTITDELKTFARKGRAAAEPVGLKTVVDGALLLLRSRFSGRLDMLRIADIPTDIRVLGSRVRLEQVLINLLQNALEAIAGNADGHIVVRLGESDEAEATIVVSDNGPGIPPEILKSLFTPFNTSKEGGLGLGLVISKDIVGDYGGRIAVDSGPNGTTFTVTLKRA
ncbi:sensor histidine kinase [Rhizobium daejeonense]|uniref:C4-dicarboxylate transport sensor protein n=1 Tax=Rhizobium daejeonense TaxID=240521 RepID=A0A6M1RU13_9HYPH|nr:ATP-binding protein [Rhizobium daejeonense]NGO62333.1 sensor histidine kinase [Rhizobium daejeonense]